MLPVCGNCAHNQKVGSTWVGSWTSEFQAEIKVKAFKAGHCDIKLFKYDGEEGKLLSPSKGKCNKKIIQRSKFWAALCEKWNIIIST